MRTLIDKILRFGIKLSMLTGVAFTMAACYGPAPSDEYWDRNAPEYQEAQQKLEQQINETATEISPVVGELETK